MYRQGELEVATGAFIVKGGKLLLATGPKFHNKWTVPGGHVNYRESSSDCVEREAREELLIEVKATDLIGIQEKLNHRQGGRDRHFIFINWKCKMVKGTPDVDGREFTETTWMDLKQAASDENVMESVRETVKKMIEMKLA